jgi:hypothetical protein
MASLLKKLATDLDYVCESKSCIQMIFASQNRLRVASSFKHADHNLHFYRYMNTSAGKDSYDVAVLQLCHSNDVGP